MKYTRASTPLLPKFLYHKLSIYCEYLLPICLARAFFGDGGKLVHTSFRRESLHFIIQCVHVDWSIIQFNLLVLPISAIPKDVQKTKLNLTLKATKLRLQTDNWTRVVKHRGTSVSEIIKVHVDMEKPAWAKLVELRNIDQN